MRHSIRWILPIVATCAIIMPLIPASVAGSATGSASTLTVGATLGSGSALRAGAHKLVMQSDGNLVMYRTTFGTGAVTWSSRTAGNPGARVVLQVDGNLVLYSPSNRPLWSTRTAGTPASRLAVQTDGNAVLYGSGRAFWSTGTAKDSLFKGESLRGGQSLRAGAARLVMQGDGNAVAYLRSKVIWSSRTSGKGATLVLQRDGNLVVRNKADRAVWAAGTNGRSVAQLRLTPSGTPQLLRGSTVIWPAGSRTGAAGTQLKPPATSAGTSIGRISIPGVGYYNQAFYHGGSTLARTQQVIDQCRIATYSGVPGASYSPATSGILWLAAHDYCVWSKLPSLSIGSTVTVTHGGTYTYRVVDRVTFPTYAWSGSWVTNAVGQTALQIGRTTFQPGRSYLALQTCLTSGGVVVYFAAR